jgi:hypothetical protein
MMNQLSVQWGEALLTVRTRVLRLLSCTHSLVVFEASHIQNIDKAFFPVCTLLWTVRWLGEVKSSPTVKAGVRFFSCVFYLRRFRLSRWDSSTPVRSLVRLLPCVHSDEVLDCLMWWSISRSQSSSKASRQNVSAGVFQDMMGMGNSSHSQSRSKASPLCEFSGERLDDLMLWSISHSQSRSTVSLQNVFAGVFQDMMGMGNSSHSEDSGEASLQCVFAGAHSSHSVGRNSSHSQSKSKASLQNVFARVFQDMKGTGKSSHSGDSGETSSLCSLSDDAWLKQEMSQLCQRS